MTVHIQAALTKREEYWNQQRSQQVIGREGRDGLAKSKIKHLKGNDEQPDASRRVCISGKPRGPIPTAPYSQLATTTHLDAKS